MPQLTKMVHSSQAPDTEAGSGPASVVHRPDQAHADGVRSRATCGSSLEK